MRIERLFNVLGLIVFLFVMLGGSNVVAQDDARKIFKKGLSQFESGEFKMASESFRKSYNIKASWKILYNIGQSEAAAKRYGLALESFEKYLTQGGDDVIAERREEVIREIQRLRIMVGVIKCEVIGGTELFVDGFLRGITPFEGFVRVSVGRHNIELKKDGEVKHTEMISIASGMTSIISIKPEADEDKPEDKPVKSTSTSADASSISSDKDDKVPGKKLIVGGIILGVVGLGATGVGVGFLVKGSADYEDRKAYFNQYAIDGLADTANKFNDADDALKLDKKLLIVGFAAGGALLITATVLTIIGLKKKNTESNKNIVTVVPTIGGLAVTF